VGLVPLAMGPAADAAHPRHGALFRDSIGPANFKAPVTFRVSPDGSQVLDFRFPDGAVAADTCAEGPFGIPESHAATVSRSGRVETFMKFGPVDGAPDGGGGGVRIVGRFSSRTEFEGTYTFASDEKICNGSYHLDMHAT
jgi:hypothetical protein